MPSLSTHWRSHAGCPAPPLPSPHCQVAHLNLPGSELFRKLRQLKSEKGGLTSQDERHYAQLRRSLEAEVLAHADVVSTALGNGRFAARAAVLCVALAVWLAAEAAVAAASALAVF